MIVGVSVSQPTNCDDGFEYHSWVQRLRPVYFLLVFVLPVCFFGWIGLHEYFSTIGVPIMQPSYADLRLITSASECAQDAVWSLASVSCDPWNRAFNYPSLWITIFSSLGIAESHTALIGLLQIVLLIACLAYWGWFAITLTNSRKRKILVLVLTIFFMSSPPITLLMERGNVDILIFSGITMACVLLRRRMNSSATSLLILLGALKLYPMAGLLAINLKEEKLTKKLTIGVFLFLTIWTLSSELGIIAERSQTAWNQVSYGISMIPLGIYQKLNLSDSKTIALLSGWILFALSCVILFRLLRVHLLTNIFVLNQNKDVTQLWGIFLPILLLSYLLGTSFDYRLVLLFPIVCTSISLFQKNLVGWLLVIVVVFVYGGHFSMRFPVIGLGLNIASDLLMIPVFSLLFLVSFHLLSKANLLQTFSRSSKLN